MVLGLLLGLCLATSPPCGVAATAMTVYLVKRPNSRGLRVLACAGLIGVGICWHYQAGLQEQRYASEIYTP